jgi:hypothetical protein
MFIASETEGPKLGRSGMESEQKRTYRFYEAPGSVAASCYERAAARALARQSPGQSQRERVAR